MIWDGACHFCKRWIERLREITVGKVDYATYQEAAARFPEIPVEQFKRAVAFIEADGEVFFAAEAVYRSLRYRSSKKWLAWSYDHVLGFAGISETAYKFIARHRGVGSTFTRFLWGKDVRPPTYFWARRWFLRMLGLVYLIAFVSLWIQVDGLVGSNGMSPVSQFLPAVQQQLGLDAYFLLPTLCWFDSSNAFLHFLCGGGVVLSLLLIFGVAPALLLVVLFVFYLSLTIAGQVFLNFQWDVLDLSCAMATMATGPFVVASIGDPRYSDLSYSFSGLTSGFIPAQVPSLQTNAYVRRREANQRRRFLGLAESVVSLECAHST